VIIPKYIEIKTSAGVRSAFLSPKSDGLKECYPDVRLNGESTFEFMLPSNSSKLAYLTPECLIYAGGRVYNLLKEDASDTIRDENNRLWTKFMSEERWNELDTQYPEPYITNDPFTPTPADLAVIIVSGGSDLSGGLYTVGSAAHALYASLNGSGWTIGTVDVTGVHDLEMEKVSRLQLIKEIQNIWGGYIVWDSVNKTVSLRSALLWVNYTGFQVRYKKNLKNITRTQSNKLTTKLYAFGKDDLDIASVNGGLKYIVDHSYTNNNYTGIYKNPDIDDAQELKDIATAELSLICRPKYLYRIKIADLRTLPEYSHEDFSLGDMVDVIDPDVAPDSPRPRLLRHKYNLFQPWNCDLELGDPNERLVESLKASFDTSGYIDNTLNSSGRLSGFWLEDGSVHADKIVTYSLIVGTNVQIGSAQDAEGVTTIIGGTVTTSFVNALNVHAYSVDAENLTGIYVTGKTVRTAASPNGRIELSSTGFAQYDNENKKAIEIGTNEVFRSIIYWDGASQIADLSGMLGGSPSNTGLQISAPTLILQGTDHVIIDGTCYINDNAYMGGDILATKPYVTSALTAYATQSWVGLQGYATQSWVNSQGYAQGSGLTTFFTSADGYTYYIADGIIVSEVGP
jgi:hypothetical protein